MVKRIGTATAVLSLAVLWVTSTSAQNPAGPEGIELSGNWVSRNFTESISGTQLLKPFDALGYPLSEAGRDAMVSYTDERLSMPERQCDMFSPNYLLLGPPPLKIWNEPELRTGSTVAWIVGGWLDIVPMVIWMDGRPHPSAYAPHSNGGFSTGTWENDVLTVRTTHISGGVRRMPRSDLTTMTTRFSRHADILTVTARIEDPVHLAEPMYVSREFQSSNTPLNPSTVPCVSVDEGVPVGKVPHYLPGENPFVDEITKLYGVPVEAILGGPETMYPEYRKKIRDKYVRPEKCPPTEAERGFCGRPGLYAPVN